VNVNIFFYFSILEDKTRIAIFIIAKDNVKSYS